MSSSKQVPASIRYLKARLRTFARPAFWGSAIALVMMVIGVWEYWVHPEWLNSLLDGETESGQVDSADNPSDDPNLSQESSVIGADIDNLPALMQEFNRGTNQGAGKKGKEKAQDPTQQEGLFEQLTRNPATASNTESTAQPQAIAGIPKAPQNSNNPFLTSAQDLLNTGLNVGPQPNTGAFLGLTPTNQQAVNPTTTATSTPNLGFGVPNLTNQNQNVLPVNSLQQALNQNSANQAVNASPSGNTSQQTLPNSTSTGQMAPPPASALANTTGYSTPLPTTSNATQGSSTPNSYTYLTQPQAVPPVVAPAVPVTPQIAPPVAPITTSNYGQYPSGANTQRSGFNSNSGFGSNLGNSGAQPGQLNQPNFTAPRRVPGRYIGGGQINTFSNP
ncbi:hypothetical protein H6F78_19990 [Coleofasciculus sp. FACHB-64]|uniref:hypothetical protein n=1 Tax=Cyanophyceae TaxID=3028117 RepID=UPI00168485F6|nr:MULTISPECIES: hypothetical protein [unclassified Coleofasciculus]MBD1841272.1 hypothetical protein [Coleofasciculus sp. FACHB-501]MBD2047841.1 hypothetical protein [Coleofasciculus sp. FACHB-64]